MTNFHYLNVNPLGKKEEDCVTRAIAGALNLDYYVAQEKLHLISKLFDCEKLCVCCYKHLLNEVYKLQIIEGYRGLKISSFLKTHRNGIYIIRVHGHLTWVLDGVIQDIWNCENEIIDIIWKV